MIQTVIRIEKNGTVIRGGPGEKVAVKEFKNTACVNDGKELSIGSVCANAVEITLFDLENKLDLTVGDEITVMRNDGNGSSQSKFIIEQPTRPTANTIKITGYDFVTKLDKDLTLWVNSLTGWPYDLGTFAEMVATECGLRLVVDWEDVVNADIFKVPQFSYTGVTGRKIMHWLCEICVKYCYADGEGCLRWGWYEPSGVTINATGDRYYFEGGLTYEAYQTAPIEAAQLQLANSESGALWPEHDAGLNSYVIKNNALLMANLTQTVEYCLYNIAKWLKSNTYTPCKVVIPACFDIRAGQTVDIVDKNGHKITAYVMTKVTEGQKDTLECTGSARRDSTSNLNNRAPASKEDAVFAAQQAVDKQTQADIFNKLTNNGELQGLYYQDGKWYINAEYVKIINLVADMIAAGVLYGMQIKAGQIQSEDGKISIDLSQGDMPIFNGGISTNELIVRSDLTGCDNMFVVRAVPYGNGINGNVSVDMCLRTTDGTRIFDVSQYTRLADSNPSYNLNGMKLSLMSPIGSGCVDIYADEGMSGMRVDGSGLREGYIELFAFPYGTGSRYRCGIDLKEAGWLTNGYFRLTEDGNTHLKTNYLNGMHIFWESNGDGTYRLVGKMEDQN